MPEPTWVLGAGGLLGRRVRSALIRRGLTVVTSDVPWRDQAAAEVVLHRDAAEIAAQASGAWAAAWCAGAGVVATPPEQLDAEVGLFERWLDALRPAGAGRVFLASSAGGVYAGSPDASPFDEHSRVHALAPYGEAKLAMEDLARQHAARTGSRVLIGRLSNLYGPGQDLAKPQGLVSQLCLAQHSRQPLGIYVSLDTLRDYLYAADAGEMVAAGLQLLAKEPSGTVVTKVMASGRDTSISALLGETTRVFRRRPPVVHRATAMTSRQVRDLRFRSVVWPELDALARTPLPVGLAATGRDVARSRTAR